MRLGTSLTMKTIKLERMRLREENHNANNNPDGTLTACATKKLVIRKKTRNYVKRHIVRRTHAHQYDCFVLSPHKYHEH